MATTVTLKPNAIDLSGSTSGTTTLQATAVAGTTTITLPAATDTLVGKATTDTLTNKTLTTPVISSLSSASATALTLQSAGTTAITVTTGQLVGVGTTSPTNTLQVAGGITATGSSPAFQASAAIMDVSSGVVRLNATGADNTTNGVMTFNTASANAGVFNERMRIDSSGNVGIGGTPKSTGVSGALEFGPSTIGLVTSQFDGPYFTSNLYYSSGWKYASTGYASMYAQYQSQHKWYTATSGSANGAVTLTQAMTLDSSGNLLVGTTVSPLVNRTNGVYSGPNGFKFRSPAGNNEWGIAATSGAIAYLYSDNGSTYVYAGTISVNGNTASYTSVSDYRLKENIKPMTGALDKVAQLKPVTYKWKADGSNGQGFIAHELQAIVPDCVSGEKDAVNEDSSIKPQSVDTSFLVATLTAALQETKALIDTQAETINALTARIVALESK